ncbi:hypothetical protein [Aquimarina sp. 2201CG5-10]|uniref:hypothetical protein n=1 Tax=Aquimarina callyspongiae TaxID=3098150 RepID=UPI002AB360CE|nr:hypothetical protein [Aquimarina sp. 2201CG5-10]MDY8134615.1 hypothetical protein [Aquimarina sp. 2201CG5-10]
MKNVAIIFILLLSFQFVNAQKFQKTNKYLVTTEIKNSEYEHPEYVVNLVRSGSASEKLSSLTIEDTELFEDIFITTLENPGLKGVSEVIKIEVEYLACCAHVEAYYFMVGENNDVVALPHLNNVYCENSDTDFQYIFPNQEYGIEGNILETQTFYTEASNIKYVNLKQSYTWNENNKYSRSKTTAITGF